MEVDLRSHADGCSPAQAVGYIEGWYVAKDYRRHGLGGKLISEAEDWPRSHKCVLKWLPMPSSIMRYPNVRTPQSGMTL